MPLLIRRIGRLLLAQAMYLTLVLLAALAIWSVVWTWPVVWRLVLASLLAALAYRIVTLGDRLIVVRLLVAALVGIAFFVNIRNGHPDSQGEWIMTGLLVVVPAWIGIGRRLPGFFAPPAPNTPDAANEERSPREFTSDEGARMVDAFDTKWGPTRPVAAVPPRPGKDRRGQRAVHAHGTWARGVFTPTPSHNRQLDDWLSYEDIPLLGKPQVGEPQVDAIVRFSNFSGAAKRDDRLPQPHGMAIRLLHPEHAGMDLVGVDMKRFMVRNREDFHVFIEYFARPMFRRLIGWLGMALTGRTTLQAILGMRVESRSSYGDRTYHGLSTFCCTIRDPEKGRVIIPIRYRFVPTHDRRDGSPLDIPDRLDRELQTRLGKGASLGFRIELVDGRDVDKKLVNDPIRPWDDDQSAIPMGHLELTHFVASSDELEALEALSFNPHRLPEGIRPNDDEILMARRAAYPESHLRRTTYNHKKAKQAKQAKQARQARQTTEAGQP